MPACIRWLVLAAALIALLSESVAPARARTAVPNAPAPAGALVFDVTGQWLAGNFRTFWERNGSLKQFGYPISPPLRGPDGTTVQWLERARFEYHPNLPAGQRVLLGQLGSEMTIERGSEAPFVRVPDYGDASWFEATGHTLRHGFRAYWQATGGLPIHGYPISEEFVEVNPDDQRPYTVQYFQRSRLEWHPELPREYQISLGLLGRHEYSGGGEVGASPPDDAPRPVKVEPATTARAVPSDRVTAIGDSVMLGAAGALRQRITTVEVDAAVSRQLASGVALIGAKRAAGTLGPVVVVHLANNGGITAGQFDQLMSALRGQRRVIVVNLQLPRAWEAGNNAVIAGGIGRYPNAVLADWKAVAGNRPDFFWDDGIHLRPAGAQAYAVMVADALGG